MENNGFSNQNDANYLNSIAVGGAGVGDNDDGRKKKMALVGAIMLVAVAMLVMVIPFGGKSLFRRIMEGGGGEPVASGDTEGGGEEGGGEEPGVEEPELPKLRDGYIALTDYHDGMIAAEREVDEVTVFLDENQNEMFTFDRVQYTPIGEEFHDGRLLVGCNNATGEYAFYGYLGKDGTLVIKCQFALAGDFDDGKAAVALKRDLNVNPETNETGSFAEVRYGMIDTSGKFTEDEVLIVDTGDDNVLFVH